MKAMPNNTVTPPARTPEDYPPKAPWRQNGRGFGPLVGPLGIFDYDDPVSIRARKYATGPPTEPLVEHARSRYF